MVTLTAQRAAHPLHKSLVPACETPVDSSARLSVEQVYHRFTQPLRGNVTYRISVYERTQARVSKPTIMLARPIMRS